MYDLNFKDYELTLTFKQIQFTFNNPKLINKGKFYVIK